MTNPRRDKSDKMATSYNPRLPSLISQGASEERGSSEFAANFIQTYIPRGAPQPPFFVGALKHAMMTAWSRPAVNVKLLAIYLHSEANPVTKRFVRIFQSGRVHQLLTNNCVLWGWDVSLEENGKTLLRIISENLGYDNSWRLQSCGKNMFPCFIFLSRTDKKSGVALIQFLRASTDLSFAVALFANAVQIFTAKIRPQLIQKEDKHWDKEPIADRSRTENAENVSQSRRPKNLSKGRPPGVDPTEDLIDGNESIQSLADKMVGRAADLSALFDLESGSKNSEPRAANYPHRSSDEAAKKRLAELKKQYMEAEYQRLKAEKRAIFTRVLQEDLARNQPGPSTDLDGTDWELRKKLKDSRNDKDKSYVPSKKTFRPKSSDQDITIRFRSHKELFEKKFKADDTFEKLLLYLTGKGYSFTEFKILAGWPRVDISGEDSRTPLRLLNFHFKDNVILAKRKTPYPYSQ